MSAQICPHMCISNAHSSVGRGALVRVGTFWYPARLLKRHIDRNGSRFWRVSIWRLSECIEPPYSTKDLVPEEDIRDELWQERSARRQIRVRIESSNMLARSLTTVLSWANGHLQHRSRTMTPFLRVSTPMRLQRRLIPLSGRISRLLSFFYPGNIVSKTTHPWQH